jgi:hypothetical protein
MSETPGVTELIQEKWPVSTMLPRGRSCWDIFMSRGFEPAGDTYVVKRSINGGSLHTSSALCLMLCLFLHTFRNLPARSPQLNFHLQKAERTPGLVAQLDMIDDVNGPHTAWNEQVWHYNYIPNSPQ